MRGIVTIPPVLRFRKVGTPSDVKDEHPADDPCTLESTVEEEKEEANSQPIDPFHLLVLSAMETHGSHDELSKNVRQFFEEKHNRQIIEVGQCHLDDELAASAMLLDHVCSLADVPTATAQIVQEELYNFTFPRISYHSTNISSIPPGDLAKLLSWYAEYWNRLSNVLDNSEVPQECQCLMEELKSEYLHRGVHEPLRSMIANRLALMDDDEDEIREDEQGHLVTRHPEDLLYMLEMHLSVAHETVPACLLPEIVVACHEELFGMAGELMLHIEANWRTMDAERLCATINDAQRLLDLCEDQNSSLGVELTPKQLEEFETLLRSFAELSLHASKYLCERIILDVTDDYLARIGSRDWVRGGNMIETTLATLQDYFDDIQRWIPTHYYFPKILKHCFDLVLRNYLAAFFSHTRVHRLHDVARAAMALQDDWMKLWKFFGSFPEENYAAGNHSKDAIWKNLHVLQVMSSILSSRKEPIDLLLDVSYLLKQFGNESGVAAARQLIRQRRQSAQRRRRWNKVIERAQAKIEQSRPSKTANMLPPWLKETPTTTRTR